MRLPWLQVDQDGITMCRLLARLLGSPERPVTETQGIGIGLALWQWALEIAPEGDFAGFVPDPGMLAAAVMWPVDDAPRLIKEMQRVGMVATEPQLRVRGLDRYRRAWEKNTGKKAKPAFSGRVVPEPGANPARLAPVPARQTQTQIEIQTEEKIPAGASAPPPKVPPKSKAEKPTDPRHAPLVAQLTAAFASARGSTYPFGRRDARAVADLLARSAPEAIATAWGRALDHRGFPSVSTLSELVTHLAHFVGEGPAPPIRPNAPAPVADWFNATPGEIPP